MRQGVNEAAGREYGERFARRLEEGEIREATRPNRAKDYTGDQETIDLSRFCEFMHSYTYRDLFREVNTEYGTY